MSKILLWENDLPACLDCYIYFVYLICWRPKGDVIVRWSWVNENRSLNNYCFLASSVSILISSTINDVFTLSFVNLISQNILCLYHSNNIIPNFNRRTRIFLLSLIPDFIGHFTIKFIYSSIFCTYSIKDSFHLWFRDIILFVESMFLKFFQNILIGGHQL